MSFLLLKRLSENKVNHPKQTKNGRGKKDYKDWTTKYKIWLVVACEKKGREEVSLKKNNIRKVSEAQKYRSLEFLPESIIIYKRLTLNKPLWSNRRMSFTQRMSPT